MVLQSIFIKSSKAKPSLEKKFSVLSFLDLLISNSISKLKSLEIQLRFICSPNYFQLLNLYYQQLVKPMNITVEYQLQLRNNGIVDGKCQAKIGMPIDDFKIFVLEKEGFKNYAAFACIDETITKVTVGLQSVAFVEKVSRKVSRNSKTSRKYSSDSMFEQSSMDFERDYQTFIADEPQKPPLVRGTLKRVNKVFCCFSSNTYLELRVNTLLFYNNSRFQTKTRQLQIREIQKVRSYRKKDQFFISVKLQAELLEFSFKNSNICKEWMGYLMQAMEFARYLCERKSFSKAQSFRQYMESLHEEDQAQVVVLEEDKHVETVHEKLPIQGEIQRNIKKLTKFREFQIQYKIGSGSFSIVYLARRKGQTLALKQLSKNKLLSKNQMKYALTELRTLTKCRQCPFVIPLYFAFQTMDYLYLAMHYIPSGDLSQQIRAKTRFTLNQAFSVLAELVFVIQFLHSQKIIYRDLKPENIMLDTKGHIFLVDYGLAKQLSSQNDYADSFLGTPLYLAPQRFEGTGAVNFKSDIYGVGCIFYQMLHGQSPFKGSNYQSLAYKIKNDEPDFQKELPSQFLSFLHSSMEKDPDRRLSQMSNHTIFKNTDWKKVAQRQGQGIKVEDVAMTNSVQINYQIDQDYNEETYPSRLISQWQFNYQSKL